MAENVIRETTRQVVRWTSGINAIVGLWLILAPFVLGYALLRSALWNDIIIGAAVFLLALARTSRPMQNEGLSWVNFVLGIWLLFAPFIFGYTLEDRPGVNEQGALWNDMVVGVIVLILAAWSAVTTQRSR